MKEVILKALKEVGLELAIISGKKVVEVATEIKLNDKSAQESLNK